MSPGDVGLVFFPFSHNEPQPYKQRPVLVLSSAQRSATLDETILVAMITGNASRYQSPKAGDVRITSWQSAGLLKPSVVRSHRIWTAERRDFARIFGQVEWAIVLDVARHVRALLPKES